MPPQRQGTLPLPVTHQSLAKAAQGHSDTPHAGKAGCHGQPQIERPRRCCRAQLTAVPPLPDTPPPPFVFPGLAFTAVSSEKARTGFLRRVQPCTGKQAARCLQQLLLSALEKPRRQHTTALCSWWRREGGDNKYLLVILPQSVLNCMDLLEPGPWVPIGAPPCSSCVTLGRLFNLSVPRFCHLENGDSNNSTTTATNNHVTVVVVSELTYVEHLKPCSSWNEQLANHTFLAVSIKHEACLL